MESLFFFFFRSEHFHKPILDIVKCMAAKTGNLVLLLRRLRSSSFDINFNPFDPLDKLHLIFPHIITPELHIKVTRIKKMITNL